MNETETFYKLIKSDIGWIGVAWSKNGIVKILLPEKNKFNTKNLLCSLFLNPKKMITPPTWMPKLETLLENFFQGIKTDFGQIPLDLRVTPFQEKVYNKLKKVPYGKLITYKDLAVKIGSTHSSRAIGNALGKNPTPLIIPCHRVISSAKNSLGGFSAFGGVKTKKRLIDLENSKDC